MPGRAGQDEFLQRTRRLHSWPTDREVLAMPRDPTAAADEIRRQLDHASPEVRDVLKRLPRPTSRSGTLGTLISDLHSMLTE